MDKTRRSVADRTIDFLVDHRWLLAGTTLVTTIVLAVFAGRVTGDPSMKSGIDTTSEAYHQYQNFMEHFGNEEFILVALKQDREARDPEVLRTVLVITEKLKGLDNVTEVVSVSNLKVFSERKGLFGIYPLVSMQDGIPVLPEKEKFENIRKALRVTDFLVSRDLETVGFLVSTDEKNRFEIPLIEKLVREVSSTIEHNMLAGSQYRIVGPQVIRLAVHNYNLQTAVIFGILCLVIGTGISLYIFKSMRVAVMTYVIVGLVVMWIVAFMSLSLIPNIPPVALVFGLMGWTGISLDVVTVFAASVALGLAVDDTIHFLSQLKLEVRRLGDNPSVEHAVQSAYDVTAKAMLSTSLVLFFGFLVLIISPFRPVVSFGVLGSASVLTALLADVVFMPSIILSSNNIRNLITRKMGAHTGIK